MELRDGRTVDLRPVTPGDALGLEALYGSLSPEDRHLRFFSAHRVAGATAEEFARVEEFGGFGIVAVEPATGELVGDGRCGPVEDGLTDMAVTVRADYQGVGLGIALRDGLSAEARRRGIDMLVADLLCENHRMHHVLQSLPHVVVDRPDDHVVRLAYRTDGGVPNWPSESRPRVLVESRAWLGTMDERVLRAAGVQVAVCAGPDDRRGRTCPVAAGGRCPLVDGADAVIFGLPLDDGAGRRVLEGHAAGGQGGKVSVRPWPRQAAIYPSMRVLKGQIEVDEFLGTVAAGTSNAD